MPLCAEAAVATEARDADVVAAAAVSAHVTAFVRSSIRTQKS